MRKGIKAAALLFLFTFCVSGCGLFDFNMMTCPYKESFVTYEIQYKNEDIKGFSIVREIDVTSLSEENFALYVEEAEAVADTHNEVDGIEEEVDTASADKKIVTITTEIDYEEYDVEEDLLNLFPLELTKKDFESVETLRNTLNANGFSCDPIVAKKLN